MLFQLLSSLWMKWCKVLIYVLFYMTLPFIAVLTRFLIIGKIQDGGHCYQIKYTLFFKKIKGFPLKTKSFRNTATYKKLRGGVPSTPLFPCTMVGVWICVYVRRLNAQLIAVPTLTNNFTKRVFWRLMSLKQELFLKPMFFCCKNFSSL